MKKMLIFLFYFKICFAIPDLNLYLYKQVGGDKFINWSKVLKIENNATENITSNNIINMNSYYVEKNIRNYSTADVIIAIRNNKVVKNSKSINNDFSLVDYNFEDNNGCLSYSISIINKKTLYINRLRDKFCYLDDYNNYPKRTFTYNTPVSKFTNNQNGYSYLFIFDNKIK